MNRGAAQLGNAMEAAASVATSAALGFASAGASAVASGLGSVAAAGAKALSGESGFFDETVTPEKIKHLLDNIEAGTGKGSVMEKVEGMKYILAQMARGSDASGFYPDVVRNVITKAVELKKLVYSYLVAYADYNPTCRELALLAINSFQRDLSDSNQLVRAMALRVLASIRERAIVQIQLMSLKKCASDSSPYVRKTAAHACGKIYQTDTEAQSEIVDAIETLLGDKNTQVLSSVIAAFAEVCPNNLALLHPHYRKLCALLADLDDWGQITALGVLGRYVRTFFAKPAEGATAAVAAAAKAGKKKDFYASDDEDSDEEDSDEESEEEEEEEDDGSGPKVPEDHALLLRVAAPLLRSRNSGVVLAVASLYASVGTHDVAFLPRIGRALVRVSRNHREIQFVVLSNIVTLSRTTPDMFRAFLKDFYVAESEPAFVRRMKVDVLAAIVSADNAAAILREFTRYVKDDDKEFVRYSIQAVVRIANALPAIADKCLRGLMGLVTGGCDLVVAESVVAIRQLLQQHAHHDGLIVRLVKRLDKISSPSARAAIVWVLGEFQSKPKVAAMAPDALRLLAKSFRGEACEVKAQIVNLAAKTSLWQPASVPVQRLFAYVLDMARYDGDYDLRDRSRLLRYLVLGSEVTQLSDDAAEEAGAVIAVKRSGTADAETMAAELAPIDAEAAAAAVAAAAATSEDGSSPVAAVAAAEGDEGAAAAAAVPADAAVDAPVTLAVAVPSTPAPRSSSPTGGASAAVATPTARLQDRIAAVLLAAKPPPLIAVALESGNAGSFALGSLSSIVGHTARGYVSAPEWAAEHTPAKTRDPLPDEHDADPVRSVFGKKGAAAKKKVDSDDEDESEEEDSDDDDEEESEEDEDESEEEESEEESEDSEEEESDSD